MKHILITTLLLAGLALGQAQRKEIEVDVFGADVNARDKDGDTPLVYAEGEIADLLRKHGCDRCE